MPVETSAVWLSDARKSFVCLRRECRAVNYIAITKLEVFSYRAGHEDIGFTAILVQGTLSRSCQSFTAFWSGAETPVLAFAENRSSRKRPNGSFREFSSSSIGT